MKSLKEKIYDWWIDNEEGVQFFAVITTIASIFYCVVWFINWLLVSILSFTGLVWIIVPVAGLCVGYTAYLFVIEEFGIIQNGAPDDDIDRFL